MEHLRFHPAVFGVGQEYQILAAVDADSFFWCEVGGKRYTDARCGVMRSEPRVHRVHVPTAELDAAGGYTVCWQKVTDRLPYFPKTEPICRAEYAFRPLPREITDARPLRAYFLADVHNMDAPALAAGQYFGKDIDLLLLGGDVPNSSDNEGCFDTIYHLASDITGGEVPVLFARGNHDLRGRAAERMADFIPNANGLTYHTFRLGAVWGIVLDCAEDKPDDHPEYGGSVDCHAYRAAQTDFLRAVLTRAATEFDAPGVQLRLVVCHVPFACRHQPPFNIEEETYALWCRLLGEMHPDLFLAGHEHRLCVVRPGDELDAFGTPCPLIIGSKPDCKAKTFCGTALTIGATAADVRFTDEKHAILAADSIPRIPQ